jgi:hypothetical protein
MYVRLSHRTFGYGLIMCSGLMALIAYLALPFVSVGPLPFVGTISFTGVQLLTPLNLNNTPGDPTSSTSSSSPYVLLLVAVLFLVTAAIFASILVFYDRAPKASLDMRLARGLLVVVSIAATVFLLMVVWPLSDSLPLLGGGFWLIAVAALLTGIGGIVTML